MSMGGNTMKTAFHSTCISSMAACITSNFPKSVLLGIFGGGAFKGIGIPYGAGHERMVFGRFRSLRL